MTAIQLLNSSIIKQLLSPSTQMQLGELFYFETIDSTNQYLLEQTNGLSQNSFCFTEQQTQGRGRQSRHWISPHAASIYLSGFWRFNQAINQLHGLSLAVGVVIIDALTDYGIHDLQLKWPNDLYYHGHKLGGILVELRSAKPKSCEVVVGIGINGCLPDAIKQQIDQPVTDLHQITRQPVERNHVIALLIEHLVQLSTAIESKQLPEYLNRWWNYDYLFNQIVEIHSPRSIQVGIAQGIDSEGCLLIKRQTDGIIVRTNGADVRVRIKS